MARFFALMVMVFGLSGCFTAWDMQGHDPVDYYAEHPVKNTVETKHMQHTVVFSVDRNRLTGSEIERLRGAFSTVHPEAVESVTIQLAPSQMGNDTRRQHLSKLLRGLGFDRNAIQFEKSKDVDAGEAEVDIAYAAAVAPHCPDWRKSPVTNYSNTEQPNFGCAAAVNLGLMVADPRDLEKGSGDNAFDKDRNALVIRNYKSGQDINGATGTGATSGAGEHATDNNSTGSAPAAQ